MNIKEIAKMIVKVVNECDSNYDANEAVEDILNTIIENKEDSITS